MTFREAKSIIRRELVLADDSKLAELIDAARSGRLLWGDCRGNCLASRVMGRAEKIGSAVWNQISDAYQRLDCQKLGGNYFSPESETRRQRVIIPMLLAEVRTRMRASELAAATEVHSIAELVG